MYYYDVDYDVQSLINIDILELKIAIVLILVSMCDSQSCTNLDTPQTQLS